MAGSFAMEGDDMGYYRRVLVILNPIAGQHDPGATVRGLERRLADAGVAHEIRTTGQEGDALRWARDAAAEGFDVVLVAGGDGTMMEAVNGVLQSGVSLPLGQIPLGTANILSRALGIPRDAGRAIDLVLQARPRRFDVGWLPRHRRWFVVAAGAGWDARMVRDTSRELKNRLGVLAYVVTAIRHLFTLRRVRIDLEVDGVRRSVHASSVLVANVGTLGVAGLSLGPHIQPSDGALDVLIATTDSLPAALRILLGMMTRRFHGERELRTLRARRVRIESRPSLPVHVDGEPFGRTPLQVEVVPGGVLLLVPDRPGANAEAGEGTGADAAGGTGARTGTDGDPPPAQERQYGSWP